MNDIFISYSRRDKVFVQKLYDCLTSANRTVWADWDSIPAASDWFAEIKQGIQETDSVVFVLSPEWVKSNECRKEMNYAVEMGKRLFPILYLPVDPKDVPPELAKINWVYMRDTDDFDKAFQTLCSAMDTDLEWIKTHTRIQVRALEWDRKKHDHSFVLRGNDLTDGEQFLAGAANKSPVPTALQSEYILASRKDSTRRQRQTLAGVTIALLVSIALGIVAAFQWRDATNAKATAVVERDNAVVAGNTAVAAKSTAIANEKEAKRQAQIALARQLAADANAILASPNGNAETAALLSVRALQFQVDEYVPAADKALNNSLNRLYTSKLFNQYAAKVSAVAYSPTSDLILVGYIDGTARLYNAITGDELQSFSGFNGYYNGDNDPTLIGVHAMAFSRQGGHFLIAGADGYIQVWDLQSKTMQEIFTNTYSDESGQPELVWSAEFSPDGEYILIGKGWPHAGSGKIEIWEIKTGQQQFSFPREQERFISRATFSRDGTSVLSTSYDGTAILWNVDWVTRTATLRQEISTNSVIRDGVLSSDGTMILLGLENGVAKLFRSDGSLIRNFVGHTGTITSVAFSPDDDHILTASVDNTARLWSIGGGNTVRVFADHTDDIWEAAYAPDGRSILTGSFDNTARIWNADFEHDNRIIHGHDGRISTVAFSPDGRFILSSSYDSTIRLWDAETLDLGHLDVPTQLNNPFFVFSAQGRWLVATGGTWSDYGGTSTVIVWEKKGEEYKPEKVLEQNVFMQVLGFSHPVDGTESEFLYLGRGEPDRILLQAGGSWDTTLRTYNNWWWNNDVALTQVASDKAQYVAVAGVMTIPIYRIDDPDTSTPSVACATPWDGAYGTYGSQVIAFSADGLYLASEFQNNILIWEWQPDPSAEKPQECKTVKQLSGHSGKILDLSFSPDGKYLLSASSDGTAILWDVKTWGKIRILDGHEGDVTSAAFSPDSKFIVTGGADKSVQIWDTNYKDTAERVCLILNQLHRDFSNEERTKYGIPDNDPTCGK